MTVPDSIGGSPIVAAEAKDEAASALGAGGLAAMLATAAAVGGGVAAGEWDAKVDLFEKRGSVQHTRKTATRISWTRGDGGLGQPAGPLEEEGRAETDRRFLLGCSSEPVVFAGESAAFLTVCASNGPRTISAARRERVFAWDRPSSTANVSGPWVPDAIRPQRRIRAGRR